MNKLETLKQAAFAFLHAVEEEGVYQELPNTASREDSIEASGAVKDFIISSGWIEEFNRLDE